MKHLPSTAQERPSRRLWPGPVFNRTVIVAGGVFYASSGLALLVAPAWFYRTVGPFPPFNRHYSGDLGAFLLPLGVGLLFAAVDGTRHRLVLLVAAGGSVLHALNHVYDAVREAADPLHLAADSLPLLVLAALLALACRVPRDHDPSADVSRHNRPASREIGADHADT